MEKDSRRKFINTSLKALAGASAGLLSITESKAARKKVAASERVNIGLIGCRGIGWANLQSHLRVPEVEITALCDVDQNILNQRNNDLYNLTGRKAAGYADFRKMLEDKDLDAVIIATPDHWHALQTIYACEAGKDVYVEKPMANRIDECYAMVAASKHFKRVVQVGQQQRSGEHWQKAVGYVHSGKLGRIRSVKAWAYIDWKGAVPVVADSPVPEGVDYDMWLGPAPKRPFNMNRFHFTFRWFWDYAGGLMTDWGVHMLDMVIFGMNAGQPKAVMAAGGKYAFPDDAMETPDTMIATYEYEGFLLTWEHTIGMGLGPYNRQHGVAFQGELGTLVVDRGGWEVIPELDKKDPAFVKYKMNPMPKQYPSGDDRDLHARNFIDCIKSRNKPVCDIETGSNVAINAHLGNIAFRTGEKVFWDAGKKMFLNNDPANELVKAVYRDPWKLAKYE